MVKDNKDNKDNKDKRDRKIYDLWLACYTQDEIAAETECDQKTVTNVSESFRKTVLENPIPKSLAEHATDFTPPIYNIWKQQTKTEGSKHFGNSEVRWLAFSRVGFTRRSILARITRDAGALSVAPPSSGR